MKSSKIIKNFAQSVAIATATNLAQKGAKCYEEQYFTKSVQGYWGTKYTPAEGWPEAHPTRLSRIGFKRIYHKIVDDLCILFNRLMNIPNQLLRSLTGFLIDIFYHLFVMKRRCVDEVVDLTDAEIEQLSGVLVQLDGCLYKCIHNTKGSQSDVNDALYTIYQSLYGSAKTREDFLESLTPRRRHCFEENLYCEYPNSYELARLGLFADVELFCREEIKLFAPTRYVILVDNFDAKAFELIPGKRLPTHIAFTKNGIKTGLYTLIDDSILRELKDAFKVWRMYYDDPRSSHMKPIHKTQDLLDSKIKEMRDFEQKERQIQLDILAKQQELKQLNKQSKSFWELCFEPKEQPKEEPKPPVRSWNPFKKNVAKNVEQDDCKSKNSRSFWSMFRQKEQKEQVKPDVDKRSLFMRLFSKNNDPAPVQEEKPKSTWGKIIGLFSRRKQETDNGDKKVCGSDVKSDQKSSAESGMDGWVRQRRAVVSFQTDPKLNICAIPMMMYLSCQYSLYDIMLFCQQSYQNEPSAEFYKQLLDKLEAYDILVTGDNSVDWSNVFVKHEGIYTYVPPTLSTMIKICEKYNIALSQKDVELAQAKTKTSNSTMQIQIYDCVETYHAVYKFRFNTQYNHVAGDIESPQHVIQRIQNPDLQQLFMGKSNGMFVFRSTQCIDRCNEPIFIAEKQEIPTHINLYWTKEMPPNSKHILNSKLQTEDQLFFSDVTEHSGLLDNNEINSLNIVRNKQNCSTTVQQYYNKFSKSVNKFIYYLVQLIIIFDLTEKESKEITSKYNEIDNNGEVVDHFIKNKKNMSYVQFIRDYESTVSNGIREFKKQKLEKSSSTQSQSKNKQDVKSKEPKLTNVQVKKNANTQDEQKQQKEDVQQKPQSEVQNEQRYHYCSSEDEQTVQVVGNVSQYQIQEEQQDAKFKVQSTRTNKYLDSLDKLMSSYGIVSSQMAGFADDVRAYFRQPLLNNFSEVRDVIHSLYLTTVQSNLTGGKTFKFRHHLTEEEFVLISEYLYRILGVTYEQQKIVKSLLTTGVYEFKKEIERNGDIISIKISTNAIPIKTYDHPFERTVVDLFTMTQVAKIDKEALVIDLGSKVDKMVNCLPFDFAGKLVAIRPCQSDFDRGYLQSCGLTQAQLIKNREYDLEKKGGNTPLTVKLMLCEAESNTVQKLMKYINAHRQVVVVSTDVTYYQKSNEFIYNLLSTCKAIDKPVQCFGSCNVYDKPRLGQQLNGQMYINPSLSQFDVVNKNGEYFVNQYMKGNFAPYRHQIMQTDGSFPTDWMDSGCFFQIKRQVKLGDQVSFVAFDVQLSANKYQYIEKNDNALEQQLLQYFINANQFMKQVYNEDGTSHDEVVASAVGYIMKHSGLDKKDYGQTRVFNYVSENWYGVYNNWKQKVEVGVYQDLENQVQKDYGTSLEKLSMKQLKNNRLELISVENAIVWTARTLMPYLSWPVFNVVANLSPFRFIQNACSKFQDFMGTRTFMLMSMSYATYKAFQFWLQDPPKDNLQFNKYQVYDRLKLDNEKQRKLNVLKRGWSRTVLGYYVPSVGNKLKQHYYNKRVCGTQNKLTKRERDERDNQRNSTLKQMGILNNKVIFSDYTESKQREKPNERLSHLRLYDKVAQKRIHPQAFMDQLGRDFDSKVKVQNPGFDLTQERNLRFVKQTDYVQFITLISRTSGIKVKPDPDVMREYGQFATKYIDKMKDKFDIWKLSHKPKTVEQFINTIKDGKRKRRYTMAWHNIKKNLDIPSTFEFVLKGGEAQFDKDNVRGRAILNPPPEYLVLMCVLNDYILRFLKDTLDGFMSGYNLGDVARWFDKNYNHNNSYGSTDNSEHDASQDEEMFKNIDVPLFTHIADHMLDQMTWDGAIKKEFRRLVQRTRHPCRMYYKTRGKKKKRRLMCTFILIGTVPSGSPILTTAGNSLRERVRHKYIIYRIRIKDLQNKFNIKQANLGDDNTMQAPWHMLKRYYKEVEKLTAKKDFEGCFGFGMITKSIGMHRHYTSFLSKDIFISPQTTYVTREINRALLGGNLTLDKIDNKLTQPIFNKGITEGLKVGHTHHMYIGQYIKQREQYLPHKDGWENFQKMENLKHDIQRNKNDRDAPGYQLQMSHYFYMLPSGYHQKFVWEQFLHDAKGYNFASVLNDY